QKITVNVALHLLANDVAHATLAELLAWKFTGITITGHTGAMVALQHGHEVVDDLLGRERRLDLANAVDDHALTITMRDREREAVARARSARRRIGEGEV